MLAGLAAATVTLLARRTNDNTLATIGAALSLVIAGLILVLIVPPLARSARLEIASFDLPIEITTGGATSVDCRRSWIRCLEHRAQSSVSDFFPALLHAFCRLRCQNITAARSESLGPLPDHIFAGEAAPVIVTLRNTKRPLPSLSVLVEARGPVADRRAQAQVAPAAL